MIPPVTTKTGGWYLGLKGCYLGLKSSDLGHQTSNLIARKSLSESRLSPNPHALTNQAESMVRKSFDRKISPRNEEFFNLDVSEVNNSILDDRNYPRSQHHHHQKTYQQSQAPSKNQGQVIRKSETNPVLKPSPNNQFKRLSMISEREDDFASNQELGAF